MRGRQGREGGESERNASGKAEMRRDAARKFYCRSLRGFHLQIPRTFPFLDRSARARTERCVGEGICNNAHVHQKGVGYISLSKLREIVRCFSNKT